MEIEIPFGAKDSELKGWEYTIPEGMEAVIENGKVIVREKESEDERIREEIIGYLNNRVATAEETELLYFKRWITYLEKQKNTKLLSWRAVDECNDIPDGHYVVVAYNSPGVFELDTVFNGKLSHPNRGNLKATGVFYIPNTNEKCIYLEKQKEPIPIPDKFSGLKSLVLQYFQSAANRTDDAEIEDDTDLWGRKILDYVWKQEEKQKEQKVDVDKLCRDIYQSGYNDGYQHGKEDAQKEQKPAEWSEKDEKILNEIIETIEATRIEASRDLPNCSVLVESYWTMLHWLKSLLMKHSKKSDNWKPSKEQMEALENAWLGVKRQARF